MSPRAPAPLALALGGLLTALAGDAASAQPQASPWINEVHHSNAGPDAAEGVEVAGPAGTPLDGWRLWAYSGYGTLYAPDGSRSDHPLGPSVLLSGTLDDEGAGLGAAWVPVRALRGGCQGLALTDPSGAVVQFLSYGGCRFNALSGPVHAAAQAATPGGGAPSHPDSLAWSTPVRGARQTNGTHRRVQQWSTLPPGHTVQLSGAGSAYADFEWSGPLPASPGRLNDWQAPAASRQADAVAGRAADDPVPLGMLAPAVDTGHDEDAPGADPAEASEDRQPGRGLAVAPPAPNPSRRATRLHVAAPPGATVEAVVTDALGRAVARYPHVAGDVVIDVTALAPGVYAVRVSSGGQAVTHRLTVAR